MSWSFLGDTFLGLHIIVINTGGQKFLHAQESSWSQWLLRRTVDDTSWPTENLNLIQNREWSSFLIRFLNSTLITLHLMISMFNNVASMLEGREAASSRFYESLHFTFNFFSSSACSDQGKVIRKKVVWVFITYARHWAQQEVQKMQFFSSTTKFNVQGIKDPKLHCTFLDKHH